MRTIVGQMRKGQGIISLVLACAVTATVGCKGIVTINVVRCRQLPVIVYGSIVNLIVFTSCGRAMDSSRVKT